MDVRVLKYFLTVAGKGNITKAAESLNITQPTLSRQLMELESELGTQLLVRGKRQITLTNSGIIFKQRAQEIVDLFSKTRQDISEQNETVSGVVSIGCVETSASLLLPDAIEEFGTRHPLVRYDIYSANGDDIRDKIDSGHLDIGVLVEPIEIVKYDSIPLPFEERQGVLMRADDPLADRESIGLEELVRLPLIMSRRRIIVDDIEGQFGDDAKNLRVVAYHNLLTNSLLLVERGLGYCITSEGAFSIRPNGNIRFVPTLPERKYSHVLVWKKNRVFAPAASMFLEYIKEKYSM